MSTRSVVAEPTHGGDSWRGRYVHSDGYPTGVGAELIRLVRRDGVEAVRKRILYDRYGWSSLDSDMPSIEGVEPGEDGLKAFDYYDTDPAKYYATLHKKGGMYGDGRFAVEPGYGVAYTTVSDQSSEDEWNTPDDGGAGMIEWTYVLTDTALVVFEAAAGTPHPEHATETELTAWFKSFGWVLRARIEYEDYDAESTLKEAEEMNQD